MTRTTQQETLDLYTRVLHTMTAVLDVLRDQPDPDGALDELTRRIEAEREWVRSLMALGVTPMRPPGWLRRVRPSAAQASREWAFEARAAPTREREEGR
jgi:hypothetical protein